jgi:DNA-binding NarL/FixJ family response regulator
VSPTIQIISSSSSFHDSIEYNCIVIGQFDGVKGLKIAESQKPTIILLDYEMEQENTSIYIKTLLVESPETKVIVLGKRLSDQIILSCLISGSFGYLDWNDVGDFLNKAIQFVGMGEAWISRRIVGLLLEKIRG